MLGTEIPSIEHIYIRLNQGLQSSLTRLPIAIPVTKFGKCLAVANRAHINPGFIHQPVPIPRKNERVLSFKHNQLVRLFAFADDYEVYRWA